MAVSIDAALSQLCAEGCGVCRYEIGSAGFADEKDYDHLGELYSLAKTRLTDRFGESIRATCVFPGFDVERLTCWNRGKLIVYVMLYFEDNTRIRNLVLGAARHGAVQITEAKPYWRDSSR